MFNAFDSDPKKITSSILLNSLRQPDVVVPDFLTSLMPKTLFLGKLNYLGVEIANRET